jgi:hypothetical protein
LPPNDGEVKLIKVPYNPAGAVLDLHSCTRQVGEEQHSLLHHCFRAGNHFSQDKAVRQTAVSYRQRLVKVKDDNPDRKGCRL